MKAANLWALFAVFLMGWVPALAQSQPDIENGFKAYGSYDGSNLDSVNLMNGNLMLHVPMPFTYPQRGGKIEPKNQLTINSKQWNVQCVPPPSGAPVCSWVFGGGPGQFMSPAVFGVGFDYDMHLAVYRSTVTDSSPEGGISYNGYDYFLTTADNSTHQLVPSPNALIDGNGDPTAFDAIDTSGFHVDLSSPDNVTGIPKLALVIDRKGNRYQTSQFGGACRSTGGQNGTNLITTCTQRAGLISITDANGNVYASTLDTMGRPFVSYTGGTAGSASCVTNGLPLANVTSYNYAGPNGATNQFQVCSANLTIQTAFGQSGVREAQNAYGVTPPVVVAVPVTLIMPDGSTWVFQYDSYGDLTSVGLPLGGSIDYTWTTIGLCNTHVGRAVTSRTLHDNNGNSFIWNYSWGTPSNGILTNVVTDSLRNDTAHVFTALDGTSGCGFYETSTQTYQGTGSSRQLLKQVDTTYSSAGFSTSTGGGIGNVFATNIKTTMYPSGRVSLVQRTPDPGLGANYPIFGLATKELEYDWGQGTPGPLLRETDTTYQWQNDSRFLTARLLEQPASVIIKDVNGNRVAETDYTYDESAYLTGYVATVGALSAGTQVAAPNPVRGNPTTVSKWVNTGASVVSHTNWYDTGEVYQLIDPLGHTTTHSYDPAYAGAYSTQTCSPPTNSGTVTHCVSGTYDFTTGALTSLTNENATAQSSGTTPGDSNHTTVYVYDVMGRLTTATHPPDPNNGNVQGVTQLIYPVPITLPFTVTRTKSITPSLNDSLTTTLDGLGRTVMVQHATPGGTTTVMTQYDGLDHATSVTNPYYSTSDLTYGTIQTQYDALGRMSQVTEQDGSIKAVAYNVAPIATVRGECTVTTDEANTKRKTCSDALGHLVEVDETNPGAAISSAVGWITVAGAEQSATTQQPASGSTTVTISGLEKKICNLIRCTLPGSYTYDTGTVTIGVGSYPAKSVAYGRFDTPATIAWNLSCAFHNDANSPVDAPCPSSAGSSTQVVLTARTMGAATNYSFTSSSATSDIPDFYPGSFSASPASGTFTGGKDAVIAADSGTVTATVNGTNYSITYGATDSTSTIATRLASAIGAGAWANASASGGTINLTSKTAGPGGNYSLSAGYTYDSVHWSQPSFTTSTSGGALTGGYNAGDPANHPFITQYDYDALGNLLTVTQKGDATVSPSDQWRVRNFTYDSLSRLLTATNPESGTISYSYDSDSQMLSKTSPAPNQTGAATQTISYCYDELHRVSKRDYSIHTYAPPACPITTPSVSYIYDVGTDAKGHLTSLTDQAGSASYTYDVLGRMAGEQRVIAGITKSMSYSYNLDSSLKALTYPSGAVVTYAVDSAGRDVSAIDSGSGINYVTSAAYGPDSSLTGFVSGNSGGFAGISNSFSYNKRLQPVNMSATSPSATVFSIGYDFHLGAGDNGNVWGIINNKDNSRNQIFTYDPLNRLTSAQNAGTDCSQATVNGKTKFWGNNYGYDAWGNLLQKSVTKCGAENLSLTAGSKNQLQGGYTYDAAGNMSHDATANLNYSYDPENRITSAAGYTYTYDGDGNRVEKASGSSGTLYWYLNPGIVAESTLAGTIQSEYIFFDGERVARRDESGSTGVFYYFSDHLKTASVVTDAAGNIKAESDYYPWGGELQFTNNDSNHYKFTGKERDSESGLDYFGARYYSNGLGRFVTPDWSSTPVPVPYADLSDPQSLNQYTYVRNTPTTKADADGHCPYCPIVEEVVEEVAESPVGQEIEHVAEPIVAAAGEEIAAGANTAWNWTKGLGVALGSLFHGHDNKPSTPKPTPETKPAPATPPPTTTPANPTPPQPQAAAHRRRRGSKKKTHNKHTGRRSGDSPPPNYVPDREHMQPKDDKKKDKKKDPYHRKDRDPAPA